MAGRGCHCQYKASCSRHFILEDAQERQDKEIFQQNMKRRLESFKSTKHNVCFAKSKLRPRKAGRKKARTFLGTSVWGWRLMACNFEPPSVGIQLRGTSGTWWLQQSGFLLHLPGAPEGEGEAFRGRSASWPCGHLLGGSRTSYKR